MKYSFIEILDQFNFNTLESGVILIKTSNYIGVVIALLILTLALIVMNRILINLINKKSDDCCCGGECNCGCNHGGGNKNTMINPESLNSQSNKEVNLNSYLRADVPLA